jgi:hypothetical protein
VCDTMLVAGFSLAEQDLAVHWLRHRSKVPIAAGWSTAPVLDRAALVKSYRPGYNLGVRCGHYSTPAPGYGLVITDTDIKVAAYAPEALSVLTELLDTIDATAVASGNRNGSRHDWRACPLDRLPPKAAVVVRKAQDTWVPPGKNRPEPVWHIEVLSTGKQVVVPPSIHPTTGHRYVWITPLDRLPLLPESMHAAVNEVLAASVQVSLDDARVTFTRQHPHNGQRPGDDFNRRADWHAILLPHGWIPVYRRGDMIYWRRPGKNEGQSATTNFANSGRLYVFTSSAPPLEANTSYSPFEAYALLEHRGDFKAAAQALASQGYGSPRTLLVTPLSSPPGDANHWEGLQTLPLRPYRGYRGLRHGGGAVHG